MSSTPLFKLVLPDDLLKGDPHIHDVPVIQPRFTLPHLDLHESGTERLLESLRHKPTVLTTIPGSAGIGVSKGKTKELVGLREPIEERDDDSVDDCSDGAEATWAKAIEELDTGSSQSRFFRVRNKASTAYLTYTER